MVFFLVMFALFLGIWFFQTIQGTFSALIMLVLTILSAAVAVNFYGPISRNYLIEFIPDYADPLVLVVLFAVILVTLRSLADNFIRSNVVIYEWPDRVAAAVLSIPTALILVGMMMIGLQMLPFDSQFLLFRRFADNGETLVRHKSFPADDFTSGFLARLSKGSLASEQCFGVVHPDWPGEVSAQRIAVQRESKHAVKPDPGVIQVEAAWKQDRVLQVYQYEVGDRDRFGKVAKKPRVNTNSPRRPREGHYFLSVRIRVDAKAADGDGYHRFAWGQVRLVGFVGRDPTATENHYVIGVQDLEYPELNFARVKVLEPPPANDDEAEPIEREYGLISRSNTFDVIFEVPEGFNPWFLEYKRWGRVLLPKVKDKAPSGTPSEAVPAAQPARSVGEAGAGWHTQFRIDPTRTQFTSEFPFRLRAGAARGSGAAGDVEIAGTRFQRGHVSGSLGVTGGLDAGMDPLVTDFEVGSDKRLLRVECDYVAAGNELFQGISGMVNDVAAQQKAYDKRGNVYLPIGKYVILDLGDSRQVELIYGGTGVEGEASAGRDQFRTVTRGNLQAKSGKVGFLYAIPPGTEMDRFDPGRPFQAQTLELRAPN